MKTALLLLLALAVATSPAWALQCYVCSSSTNCMKPQTCPASSQFCKTATTVNTLSGNLVKKECADSCVSNHSQQGQISSGSWAVHCCQGDLCNGKLYSAASVRAPFSSATLGLAMSLGLLALTALSLLRCGANAARSAPRFTVRPREGPGSGHGVALPLGDQELKQGKSLPCASLPCFFPGLGWIQDQLFSPTLSSHLHHDIPAHGAPGGSSGPACGSGSGVPRVCLQWRQLLQTHALPSHGHLLHDHSYLLHPVPDESEEVVCTQLL